MSRKRQEQNFSPPCNQRRSSTGLEICWQDWAFASARRPHNENWNGGAGLSCAVIAQPLAEKEHTVEIFEKRSHIAGNCHTTRDPATGVMVHVYGPHIFHTDDEEVWNYVNSFMPFMLFTNRVQGHCKGRRLFAAHQFADD